jgi:UDP-glucose 4-epimerase
MKCLVTGGAGFIGSHITDRLIKEKNSVAVLDNLSTGQKENLNKKARFYKTDICSPAVGRIFQKEKPEMVFHLAAQIDVRKSVDNPTEDARVNIFGALNLLQNCRKYGVKKVIFSSTGGAMYGDAKIIPTPENYPENPDSPYGIAKLTIEKYLEFYNRTFGLDFVSLRFANVYGPRQNSKGEAGVIAIFCDKIIDGEQPLINGLGLQTRDFIFVNDVVDAVISAAKKSRNKIFNVGTGKETNINFIFRQLKNILKSDCQEKHGPAKKGEQQRSCLDSSKAKKELLWQLKYSLEAGLAETAEWFLSKTR